MLEPKSHQSAYYQRGLLKLKSGDEDGAKTDFYEALRIDPNYAAVQQELVSLIRKQSIRSTSERNSAMADFEERSKPILRNPFLT